MRPSRRRTFGHPDLLDYIRAFGKRVQRAHVDTLLIGDLSQPRGGRAASGHSSHQTGLDVDIWYKSHVRTKRGRLPTALRETLSAESVVDVETQAITTSEAVRVARVLRLAAQDERVARVFVHPVIKRALCETAGDDRSYLRKLRPWHGHDDHFHVRLACPPGGEACQPQAPLPPGDGCDKLDFWFDVDAQKARQEAKKYYQQSVRQGRGWPDRCNALLTSSAG
jgi:penicillin-insensitive murein endopeptidase